MFFHICPRIMYHYTIIVLSILCLECYIYLSSPNNDQYSLIELDALELQNKCKT